MSQASESPPNKADEYLLACPHTPSRSSKTPPTVYARARLLGGLGRLVVVSDPSSRARHGRSIFQIGPVRKGKIAEKTKFERRGNHPAHRREQSIASRVTVRIVEQSTFRANKPGYTKEGGD